MIFDKFLSLLPSELDGALIMSEENRRYFTSFPSSDGVLLISRNGTVFLTDSRYVEAAQKKITVCPVRLTKDLSTELPQLMSEFKITNLAVETTRLTVAQFEEFTKWMPNTGICTENYADRAIDALRMVKSDGEVKLVCEAQVIAERAFDHILEFIKPGVTEREIQLELDYYLLRNGAEALSFETIAVSGVNSSMPHGVPSDKKIENGDFITMDYGAVVGGYLLFDRLLKVYESAYRHRYPEHGEEYAGIESFEWSGKHFCIEQIPVFAHIADCVISHNVWKANDASETEYLECGLEALVGERFKKIEFQENPLLFILAVVDTIEPYKIYSSKAADRDAVRIWKSIDISFTNNTLTLSSRYKCRPITKIYERAKGLEAWVDIESIELSSDRKSLRIKFK